MKSRVVHQISQVVVMVLLSASAAPAAVRYVALDGSGTDGQTWATAYKSIGDAIGASTTVTGDEIRVKQGTYTLLFPIMVNKAVKIYGGYNGNLDSRDPQTFTTTIDGATRVLHCFEVTANAEFDGLTIMRGSADGSSPNNQGGGMYIHGCYCTMTRCTFRQNYAEYMGGAISLSNTPGTTLSACRFIENTSGQLGGAILCRSNVTISGCEFQANEAGLDDEADGYGGAIRNESCSPTIESCTFSGNTADYGGAICNRQADPTITSCMFADCGRTTAAGGGIYNLGGSPVISGCFFRGNSVTHRGGAVWDASLATYSSCILWGNSAATYGGAVYVDESTGEYVSGTRFVNCTFYANHAFQGGALYSYNSSPSLTNCILWADTCWDIDPEIHSVTWVLDKMPTVTYCDIDGNEVFPGVGNIRADPQFGLSADNGEFTLLGSSPCVDAGSNDAIGLEPTDYAGNPRLRDGNGDNVTVVDMGARELQGFTLTDHVLRGTILQSAVYDDPNDTTPQYVFMAEFKTTTNIAQIQIQAPGGATCVLGGEPHTVSGNVETFCVLSGDTYTYQYWARFDSEDGLKNYGDGTYTITYTRAVVWIPEDPAPPDRQRVTQVVYGAPGGGPIAQPTQKPNITWPRTGVSVGSPVQVYWQDCEDPRVNSILLTLANSASGEVAFEQGYPSSANVTDPLTLPDGDYDVALALANVYDAADTAGVPIKVGRAATLEDQFTVLYTAVYRFFSPVNGVHFYTIDPQERDNLIVNWPQFWTYEGPVYSTCATANHAGVAPVYRFWSPVGVSHFYTINEEERDWLINNYPDYWTYEGIAFYAYPEGLQPSGTSPVYRFWSPVGGSHFYTTSEEERDWVISNYSNYWTYEGIAFYAYKSE